MTQKEDYAPYHLMLAFEHGIADYKACRPCPYSSNSVEGQAWDRGAEYAMKQGLEAYRAKRVSH